MGGVVTADKAPYGKCAAPDYSGHLVCQLEAGHTGNHRCDLPNVQATWKPTAEFEFDDRR